MGIGARCRVRLGRYRQTQARREAGAGDRRTKRDSEPRIGLAVVHAQPKNGDDAVARHDRALHRARPLDVTRRGAGGATHHLRESGESCANARHRQGARSCNPQSSRR